MNPKYSLQVARIQHVLNRVSQANRDKRRHIPRISEQLPLDMHAVYLASGEDEACGVISSSGFISHVAATGGIGLGRVVLSTLEANAKSKGLKRVELTAFDTGCLVDWYKSQGYTMRAIYPFDPKYDVRIDGTPDVYHLEKQL